MPRDESDWVFDVNEVSANVYRVTGRDSQGRSITMTGADPDALLAVCKREAGEIGGLTRDEARAIVREHLDGMERPDLPLELIDESTIEGPDAFVFFWNSRAYIEDQTAYRQAVLGNVPIRVDRATGEVRMLSRLDSPRKEAGLD